MASPIFIVGANRSGTTLLRLILNAHPRIAIPDELIYFDSQMAGIPVERWRRPELAPAEYEAFVDRFLQRSRLSLQGLDLDAVRATILRGPHDFRRPYRCALRAWAQHHGKERWGEKTPGNLFYADILHEMFSDARFLYLVRDPRAGVASMQQVSFFPNDVVFNALSRRKHDVEGRARLQDAVPPPQRLRVSYEELVREPERTVARVCEFIGEPFRPQMLHFHRNADRYMKDEAETSYNAAATHPITDDRVDAWKSLLSDEQIAAVESICQPLMEAFGYRPTGRSPSLAGRGEMVTKELYWKLQLWRHRETRHYTVKYPLLARTRSRIRRLARYSFQFLRGASPFHSSG
jgi:hypothetical protein